MGGISSLYVVMGVIDHYFLIKLQSDTIFFLDSLNTPLNEIITPTTKEILTPTQKRKQGMHEALNIIQDLYFKRKSIYVLVIELKVKQIMGEYFAINSDNQQ